MADVQIPETRTPDQLPRATAVSPDALVTIQEEGGPVLSLPIAQLFRRVTATDAIRETEAAPLGLQGALAFDEHAVGLVTADPDPEKSGWYYKVGASGEGNWVQFEKLSSQAAAIVQALVDAAAASAATAIQAAKDNSAATGLRFDAPNGFSDAELAFTDLSKWTITAPGTVTASAAGGRRTMRVANGAAVYIFPRSMFVETGRVSASLMVQSLTGGTVNSRLRVQQRNAALGVISNHDAAFGTVDIATPTPFSVANIALHADAEWVYVYIQTATTGGGGVVHVNDLMCAQGSSAQMRSPSYASSFALNVAAAGVVLSSNFTVVVSLNLATLARLLDGKYVTNEGSIAVAAGWKTYRIPVVPGQAYSFGHFSINTAGYSAFYGASGETAGDMVLYNGSFTTGTLPVVNLVAPPGSAWLYITVARPINVADDWAEVVINEGAELIDYVDPAPKIVAINGMPLAGSGNEAVDLSDYAKKGEDADFGNISVASLTTSALVANLPSGAVRPGGVDVGEVWIDTSGGGTDAPLVRRMA